MRKLIKKDRLSKNYTFEIKSVDKANYIIEGVFSTPAVDRHGEAVIQAGWDLTNYKNNPVVLWAHQNQEFPIAQMIEIAIDQNGNLAGKMKFAVDEYEDAATVYKLMVGKYLRAFSVGFSNNVYEVDQNDEVVNLTENELFEVSVVNVPANAEALSKELEKAAADVEDRKDESPTLSDETVDKIADAVCAKMEMRKRVDMAMIPKKVETPKATGGKFLSNRNINKAIRKLLKNKKTT